MPDVLVKPKRVAVGEPYTISGSGYSGTHVQVSVTYEQRAETYKAAVAQQLVIDPRWRPTTPGEAPAMIRNPDFSPGEIRLVEYAEHPGTVRVAVWDWPQRRILAETRLTVTGG